MVNQELSTLIRKFLPVWVVNTIFSKQIRRRLGGYGHYNYTPVGVIYNILNYNQWSLPISCVIDQLSCNPERYTKNIEAVLKIANDTKHLWSDLVHKTVFSSIFCLYINFGLVILIFLRSWVAMLLPLCLRCKCPVLLPPLTAKNRAMPLSFLQR